jgi:hypothetical protein
MRRNTDAPAGEYVAPGQAVIVKVGRPEEFPLAAT